MLFSLPLHDTLRHAAIDIYDAITLTLFAADDMISSCRTPADAAAFAFLFRHAASPRPLSFALFAVTAAFFFFRSHAAYCLFDVVLFILFRRRLSDRCADIFSRLRRHCYLSAADADYAMRERGVYACLRYLPDARAVVYVCASRHDDSDARKVMIIIDSSEIDD